MAARAIAGTKNLRAVSGCFTFGEGGSSTKAFKPWLSGSEALGMYDLKVFSMRSKVWKNWILPLLRKPWPVYRKPLSVMVANLRMKKFETASSNDLEPVMNCIRRYSARNCSNGLLVQVRLQARISRVSCAKDLTLDWLMILKRCSNTTVWETLPPILRLNNKKFKIYRRWRLLNN